LNPNHIPTIVTKIFNYTPQIVGSISPPKVAEAK